MLSYLSKALQRHLSASSPAGFLGGAQQIKASRKLVRLQYLATGQANKGAQMDPNGVMLFLYIVYSIYIYIDSCFLWVLEFLWLDSMPSLKCLNPFRLSTLTER